MTDNSLICFKAISNFIKELASLYSKQQRSLKLYSRLINKTTLTHDNSIKKHNDAFKNFCISNRNAIITKKVEKIEQSKISYSQRVFIDIVDIFKLADSDTSEIIWQHLLCISAIVDPLGKAKEVLKENLSRVTEDTSELHFITDIINKVEKHVDPDANPMEAVSSILKSGIFTDLIGGMNQGLSDGSLDIGKLMGAVQGMVGQLGEKTGGDPNTDDAMKMLSTMMGSMSGGSGGTGGSNKLDMVNMMQEMMSNMGTNDVSQDSIQQ